MYRTSSGRSNVSSSSRSKESSSSTSRSSRSATSKSGSTRDRSPRRSRSPSPRGRRRRSPSSSRSSRRSPSPRRSSRRRSSDRRSRSSDRRSRSSDRRSRSSDRRSRSSDRRSRSSDRRSRSSDRRSRSSDRRSRSSDRRSRSRSRSSDRRSRSSDRRSRSSDRRSRSPRRRSRSPRRRSRSSDRRSRSSDRRSRSSDRRSRSPGRRSRSSDRHSRSSDRRSRSSDRRPRSPDKRPRSPDKRPRSPDKRPRSPDRHSPNRHSESSVEQSLQITVGNERYSIDTPERRRLSDRLGSPVDSLSDVDRDDLADGPIFSRGLSQPRSLERYSSREKSPSSPYNMRHDEDYRSRDVFLHQSDYSINYDRLQKVPRESDRVGQLHRKSLYSSEDRGRDAKRPRYDRDDRLLDVSIEPQGFLPGTRNYRKRSISRSPSPTYLDEGFRELESARRKREEEELSRRLSRELPGSGFMIPGLTNPIQSSEPRYLYRPDEAPAMPKKSILKKRFDDPSVQPEAFSSSSAAVKEPPLLSNHPPLPQRSYIAPFSSEVDNFLKRFNKNPVAESANKESQGNVCDWRKYSGLQQNTFSFEQNFGSFLKQKEYHESPSEPVDRQSDFLLPHERASQDGSGFSRILGMMADSTSIQEKRRRSFPDIEDEEKFLYGDDEDDSNISPSTQKITMGGGKEPVSQKLSSPSSPSPTVKSDAPEEPRPEYEKIHDLLKTIGLDIGVAEIGKLAARTQERLHGKKPSRSPDRHLVASHKPESQKMHRSRSDTHSPEPMQKRSLSPSGSCSSSKAISSVSKSEYIKSQTVGQDNPAGTPERSDPPVSLIPSAPPALPNLPHNPTSVSQYSVSRFSPFTATQLPPNYPNPTIASPGYDAYGHYMAYAASGWPMYAPPQQADPALSDVHGLVTLTVPPNPTRPNLRVIETVSTGKGTSEIKRDDSALVHIPTTATYSRLLPQFSQPSSKSTTERVSDEKNRASQKQKVIGEREKLKAEQEARQKKLHYLRTELDRLSKQQGEMLRKKRREKDGHKDPLLVEVNRLQENIVKEIAQLQIHAEAAEKKQSELDKVAQILGINIFEKSRKQSTENKDSSEKNKSENAKCQEKTSSSIKESKTCNDKGKSPKPTESSSQPSKQHFPSTNIYEYYDAGGHWCKNCNITCGTMFDFFTHMHNKKHRKTLDPYNRPWASKTQTEAKQEITKRVTKIIAIAKGSEFLIPVTGYYCQLCHEFFGDQISAEQHVKSHPHNEKYKKYIDDHGLYETRWNLDRQVGSSVIQVTQCRLKRKQCEKQKEDRDEKTAKVSKKEEPKGSNELGGGDNKNEISNMNEDSTSQKFGIRLKLKKDLKEAEKKEGKREESKKESRQPSFGKFSWKKTEKDVRNQGKDECAEEGKDKESKSGKSNSKPIAIKLSGKTVIPHSSPWTPVVSTSSQPKIRPNVPVPSMVLRKNATTTVSKPAPLNTFLSIKSSGATTKPLPVVKEGNPELILPPDIISKAFGGEVVVLKGSQEDSKVPGPEEPDQETVTRAIEHARALKTIEQAKALEQARKRVQEQVMIMAKAQAKARELATMAKEQEMARKAQEQEMARKAQEQEIEKKARLNERILAQEQEMARKAQKLAALAQEQEIAKMARMNERILEQSCRRPPLLPLPQGLRPAHLPLPTPVLYPPPPALLPPTSPALLPPTSPALLPPTSPALLPPTSPAILADDMAPGVSSTSPAILADDMAPGVSEDDKNILAMPMCPHPLPPPTIFRDHAKKLEKKNSSLAAGNAKDLYGIFYNSGRSPAENKPANALDKEKLNPSESETSIDMLAESKPSNNSSSPKYLQNVDSSSDVSKIPLGDGTPETELVEVEKILAAYEENFKIGSSVEGASDNISLSDTHSTFKYGEASESHVLPANASVSFQNVVMGTPPLAEISSNPSELESAALMLQLPESSAPPLDEVSKKPSELQSADFKSSDDKVFSIQLSEDNVTALEDDVTALEDLTMKSSELQAAIELAVQLPESSAPLEEVSKKPSVLETAELAMQLSECSTPPLNDVSKKPLDLKTAELAMQLPESSALLLGEICKKAPEFETDEFKSDDKEIAIQLSEDNVTSFEDLTKKPSELETVELAVQLPESSALLLGEICKKAPEFETDEFKSDDKEIAIQLSEDNVTSFEDLTKKPSELETVELAMQLPESSALLLGEICKKAPEFETDEFKSDDKEIAIQLSEDNVTSFEDLTKKPSELETVESAVQLPESSALLLGEICKKTSEFETDEFKSDDKEIAIQLSEDHVTSFEDLTKKSSDLETVVLAMQLPESSASPLDEVSKKLSELETIELAVQLPESSTPLLGEICKKTSEFETAEFKSSVIQLSEDSVTSFEDLSKKAPEFETAEFKGSDKEIAIQLSEDNVTSFEDLTKKSSELEAVELAMQLPESGTSPLGEICMKSLVLETAEFKSPDAKMLEMQLPGRETDCSKESVAMRDVDMTSEYISQPQDQQEVEVHDGSELKEIKSDLETKAYVISLGERHVEREHSELAGHQFAISQGDPESQLFEMQTDIHKGKGPTLTEEKQSDDCSELPVSTWVSEMCVQSHLTWKPIDSSKANKENSQVMTDQSSSKKSQLNLKLGGVDGLESAIGDKNPPTSEVQNMEPELKPLNKGQFDSFHANNEDKELLGNSQPKDSEDFNVSGLGEMQEECFVNVTMISSVLERHEEICQQPSNCEVKNFPVQGTEDLGSISNTNDVEPCSSVELMFIKNDTQGLSGSDIGLSDIIERGPADKENTNFSTVQPEILKEPVDSLPAEFSVGHLEEEEALAFTGMKTGVLNTSTAGDFDLNTTYSELNFDQSTTLTLNLNVANEKDSPKSDEVKPSGPSILKPGLELETIDFSLGDIEVEREHLDILPSEILNEDTVESPKLETIAPISLESSKTCELAIDQPGGESEIIDSVALTAGDQEGKLCSLVSDVVVPASNGGTAETGMPYLKTQDVPQISEALLQTDSGKSGTPDVLLSCGGKDVQNQAAECLESPLPDLKATSIEAGSGDNELYIVKNTMHTSAGELTESEEMES